MDNDSIHNNFYAQANILIRSLRQNPTQVNLYLSIFLRRQSLSCFPSCLTRTIPCIELVETVHVNLKTVYLMHESLLFLLCWFRFSGQCVPFRAFVTTSLKMRLIKNCECTKDLVLRVWQLFSLCFSVFPSLLSRFPSLTMKLPCEQCRRNVTTRIKTNVYSGLPSLCLKDVVLTY